MLKKITESVITRLETGFHRLFLGRGEHWIRAPLLRRDRCHRLFGVWKYSEENRPHSSLYLWRCNEFGPDYHSSHMET